MTEFSVATYNCGDTGTLSDLEELVAAGVDIICCQEMSDRWKTIIQAFLRRHPGWAAYKGGLPGAAADPILVNVDKLGPVTVVEHAGIGRRWVGKGRFVRGKWTAAGPMFAKPKPMTQFVLADGTSIFNRHKVASVTKSKAALGKRTFEARRKHYRDDNAVFLAVAATIPGPILYVGDLNSEADFELNDPLHDFGLIGWTTDGTHGNRAIDHVLHLPGRGLTVTGLVEVVPTDSDHHAVVVPYQREEGHVVPTITQRVARNARARGLTVLNREQWGSREAATYATRRRTRPHKLLPDQPVDTVWQHITVTRPSSSFETDCRVVEKIGKDRFGVGVSYNFMVNMADGRIGVGQPLDAKGAHTLNDKGVNTPAGEPLSHDQNAVSIAIAVIGMPETRLSDAAELAIATLIAAAIDEGAVTPGFDYLPHSHVAAKDCPCDSTRDKMPAIRKAALEAVKSS